MAAAPYLLGRYLDPLFALAVGTLSYYKFETNSNRPEGHRLFELIQKRWNKETQSSETR
ncbi:hypothetical protein ACO0QE_002184 [Hanseniaspora vineae]